MIRRPNSVSKAIEGGALAPLSNEQKTILIMLAREAFEIEFPPTETDFDLWRKNHCMLAVERPGLRACRQEDYAPLKAHFLRLLGREAQADRASSRMVGNDRRQALGKLRRECEAAADVLPHAWSYAAGFIRNKRGVSMDEADAKTLWHAVFTIRRRTAQLRGKGRSA